MELLTVTFSQSSVTTCLKARDKLLDPFLTTVKS